MREQDDLLEGFYSELDEGGESFLRNGFIREGHIDDDYELENGNDNNGAENEADVIELDQENEKNWRKRRRYGKYWESKNIKRIRKICNNSTETKVQND